MIALDPLRRKAQRRAHIRRTPLRRLQQIDALRLKSLRIDLDLVEPAGLRGHRLAATLPHIANDHCRDGMHIFRALRPAQRQEFTERLGEPDIGGVEAANAHDRFFS